MISKKEKMGDLHIHLRLKKQHIIIFISLIAIFGVVLMTNALDTNQPYHPIGQVDFSDGQANADLDLDGNSLIDYGNDFATESWVNSQDYATESWVNSQDYATENYVDDSETTPHNCYWTGYGVAPFTLSCNSGEIQQGLDCDCYAAAYGGWEQPCRRGDKPNDIRCRLKCCEV